MERNRKFWANSLMVLGMLAVGLQAKPARAREMQGKFTLPCEVRWGLATLPAGDYSFRTESSRDGLVTIYRGTRPVASILPLARQDPTQKRSVIVVEAGFVRELSLPDIGESLRFAAHKPKHRQTREEEELAHTVPVLTAGAGK